MDEKLNDFNKDEIIEGQFTEVNSEEYNEISNSEIGPDDKTEESNKRTESKDGYYITKKFARRVIAVTSILSIFLGAGGGVLTGYFYKANTNSSSVMYQSVVRTSSQNDDDSLGLSTADVASQVSDSVVQIQTEIASYRSRGGQSVEEGAGSGVILTQDGYIVTNKHVIEGASKIIVITSDEKEYTATVVGSDEETDIAVIKINATDLTPAVLGNSSELEAGDKAIIIGNPLGELGGTLTEGIISALDREITLDGQTMNLLQTDAAVNPGNSGGGLFDDNAELVGIVVAKSISTEVEGLGFAIPIDDIKSIIEDIINGISSNESSKIYIGISAVDISTNQLAAEYNLSQKGVYIADVYDNTSADEAGLKKGDLITAVDGTEINNFTQFKQIINKHSAGDKIEMTIIRDNNTKTIEITLRSE